MLQATNIDTQKAVALQEITCRAVWVLWCFWPVKFDSTCARREMEIWPLKTWVIIMIGCMNRANIQLRKLFQSKHFERLSRQNNQPALPDCMRATSNVFEALHPGGIHVSSSLWVLQLTGDGWVLWKSETLVRPPQHIGITFPAQLLSFRDCSAAFSLPTC